MTNFECSKEQDSKRVLITGGASGIGAAIVKAFYDKGYRVAIFDCDLSPLKADSELSSQIELSMLIDVGCPHSVERGFAELKSCWGGIDVVVNNAGISVPAPLGKTSIESWNKVLNVNLTGVFLVSQQAANLMKAQEGGVIINIASVSGMVGMPNYLSYNVSKAGVIELTKTLALELAPSIRVNAINPGYVLTPMQESEYSKEELDKLASIVPLKRLIRPDEIAAFVIYLASNEARMITGSSLVIDGGETAGGLASAVCGVNDE